jgi:hypothetical protein
MSIVTSTRDWSGSSAMVTAPCTPVNRPRILVSMKWRPMNATSAWPGSIAQLPGAGSSTPDSVRVVVLIGVLPVESNEDRCERT